MVNLHLELGADKEIHFNTLESKFPIAEHNTLICGCYADDSIQKEFYTNLILYI